MASALGVESREIWRATTGSLSDQLEPTRPMETKKIHISLLCALLCARYLPQVYHTMVQPQTLYTLTQPRHNISRPSSFCLCDRHQSIVLLVACVIQGYYSKQYMGTTAALPQSAVQFKLVCFCCAVRYAAVNASPVLQALYCT